MVFLLVMMMAMMMVMMMVDAGIDAPNLNATMDIGGDKNLTVWIIILFPCSKSSVVTGGRGASLLSCIVVVVVLMMVEMMAVEIRFDLVCEREGR